MPTSSGSDTLDDDEAVHQILGHEALGHDATDDVGRAVGLRDRPVRLGPYPVDRVPHGEGEALSAAMYEIFDPWQGPLRALSRPPDLRRLATTR